MKLVLEEPLGVICDTIPLQNTGFLSYWSPFFGKGHLSISHGLFFLSEPGV